MAEIPATAMSSVQESPGQTDWRWRVLIVLATLATYFSVLDAGFIWNDSDYVTQPQLQSVAGLARIWFEVGATEQYYPVLHSAFWIQHRLWGDSTLGHHLANVLLHAANACVLLVLLRRLKIPGAVLAAFLFALHPVCVESVAWVSEQKNTLSTLFYLLAALAYLRFDETRRPRDYGFAVGIFVVALLTKSLTATLTGALLVVFWWKRGRLEWRRDVVPMLPLIVLGAAAGLFTGWVEREILEAKGPDFELSFLQRTLIAGRAVWFYWGKLIWPAELIFIYPRWTPDAKVWWQYLFPALLLALMWVLWSLRSRTRSPLAALLLFLGSLFPTSGYFNVYAFRFSFVADHWQYLPCISVLTFAAATVTVGVARIPGKIRWLGPAAAVTLMAVFIALSARQSTLYRDIETFYRLTLAANPDCWMAHNNLGGILADSGRLAQAMPHYEAGLRLKPDRHELHTNFAAALLRTGDLQRAAEHYREAIRLNPKSVPACDGLGVVLHQSKRHLEAIEWHERAIKLRPTYTNGYNNLGLALTAIGRTQNAITAFQEALRLAPHDASAHNNIAVALSKTGRESDAALHLAEALRLRPDYAAAHDNLGNLLQKTGRPAEAVSHYETALRFAPASPITLNNLGTVLRQLGRIEESIAYLQKALSFDPNLPATHFNLALALQAAGRLPEAKAHYQTARKNQPDLPIVAGLEG